MTLNKSEEAARLVSVEDQGDDGDGHIVDSDENEDKSAKEIAQDFQDLQDSARQATPAQQAIRYLCIKYEVKDPSDMAGA